MKPGGRLWRWEQIQGQKENGQGNKSNKDAKYLQVAISYDDCNDYVWHIETNRKETKKFWKIF